MPAAIRRSIWGLTAAVLLGVFVAGPAVVGAAIDEPPAPVMAVVDPGPGAGFAVTTTGFYLDPAATEPTMIIRLNGDPAALPDGSRVAVQIGDPDGQRMRASLVLEAGVPIGVLEQGDGISWNQVGEVAVSFTVGGDAAIGVPELSGEVAWVEVTTPDGAAAESTFFPFDALSGTGSPGVVRPSRFGRAVAPGEVVGVVATVDSQPQIEVVNQAITVSSDQRLPADALGVPVVSTRDFVRLSPGDPADGRVPFFVLVDHSAATVTLWDASGDIPIPMDVPEDDWLTKGLDPEAQVALDGTIFSVALDREGLLAATGMAGDSSTVAVGPTRVLTLEDGRLVTSDGVLGTFDWYENSVGATLTPPPETPLSLPDIDPDTPVTLTPVAADDGGTNTMVVLIAALLAAGLAVAALLTARASRRRAEIDSDPALGAMAKVVSGTDDSSDGDETPAAGGTRAVKVPDADGPTDATATGVGVAGARAAASREALARRQDDTPAEPPAGKDAMWSAMRKRADDSASTPPGPLPPPRTDAASTKADKDKADKAEKKKPSADKDKADKDKADKDKADKDKADKDKADKDKADKAEKKKPSADKDKADEDRADKAGMKTAESDRTGQVREAKADKDPGAKADKDPESKADRVDPDSDTAKADDTARAARSATVAPDDALDALNQLIDDLPLPPES